MQGVLDPNNGEVIGVAVESLCQFKNSLSFPDIIEAGIRVGKLGRSSVRYEIGIFKKGDENPSAIGYFVHCFVDKITRKPVIIPPPLRAVLEKINVEKKV